MATLLPTPPSNRHIFSYALVNGKEVKVMFDTGAGRSILALNPAARAGLKPQMPGAVDAGLGAGIGNKRFRQWVVPVDSFVVGAEQILHTKIVIGEMFTDDYDMLLGADFFLSHRVYVSNAQGKLYFTYNGGPIFDLYTAPPAPSVASK